MNAFSVPAFFRRGRGPRDRSRIVLFWRHRSIAMAGWAAMSVPMSFSSETLRGRSLESAATELESATGASRLANTSAYWFETPSMPTAS